MCLTLSIDSGLPAAYLSECTCSLSESTYRTVVLVALSSDRTKVRTPKLRLPTAKTPDPTSVQRQFKSLNISSDQFKLVYQFSISELIVDQNLFTVWILRIRNWFSFSISKIPNALAASASLEALRTPESCKSSEMVESQFVGSDSERNWIKFVGQTRTPPSLSLSLSLCRRVGFMPKTIWPVRLVSRLAGDYPVDAIRRLA